MMTQVNQTIIFRGAICSIVDVQPKKILASKWSGGFIEIKTIDIKYDKDLVCWRASVGKKVELT